MAASYTLDTSGMDKIIRETPARADAWLRSVAMRALNDMVLSFGTGGVGRTYQRGKRTHQASAPGGPPNVDLGTLRASLRWRRLRELEYVIEDGVEYGIYLEDGTERMGARPWMGPVMREWQNKLEADARAFGLINV